MILGATFVPTDPDQRRDEEGKKVVYLPDDIDTIESADGDPTYRVKATDQAVQIQWDKMSKSRGNVVNPDEVVAEYGADSVRLYEMFMGPLEQSAPWQTEGLAGMHRFLSRVYRLAFDATDDASADVARTFPPGEGSERQRKLLHKTIAEVSDRVERLAFNTAISSLMVFVRDVLPKDADGQPDFSTEPVGRGAMETFTLLLSPFAPHLAEHIWRGLGHEASLAHETWPTADEALLAEDTFALVVQVNGKRRDEVQAPKNASRDELAALARATEAVQKRLADVGEPKRVIVVPGRLVNFVM
jgi:leucyl-tRNA synthetase